MASNSQRTQQSSEMLGNSHSSPEESSRDKVLELGPDVLLAKLNDRIEGKISFQQFLQELKDDFGFKEWFAKLSTRDLTYIYGVCSSARADLDWIKMASSIGQGRWKQSQAKLKGLIRSCKNYSEQFDLEVRLRKYTKIEGAAIIRPMLTKLLPLLEALQQECREWQDIIDDGRVSYEIYRQLLSDLEDFLDGFETAEVRGELIGKAAYVFGISRSHGAAARTLSREKNNPKRYNPPMARRKVR